MTSSSRRAAWHEKTLITKPQSQNYFLPGRSTRAPLPLIKLGSADKSYILFLQRRNRAIEFQPLCLLYGNDWGILLSLKVSGWSICSLFSFNYWRGYAWPVFLLKIQGLFASFHLCTKCTSPPISVGKKKKRQMGTNIYEQRHFYFIWSMHPGAILLVRTNSHCRKNSLIWRVSNTLLVDSVAVNSYSKFLTERADSGVKPWPHYIPMHDLRWDSTSKFQFLPHL